MSGMVPHFVNSSPSTMCGRFLPLVGPGAGSYLSDSYQTTAKSDLSLYISTDLVGPTDMEYFEWEGEHYLVIVQVP
jgi:hypothetical protein